MASSIPSIANIMPCLGIRGGRVVKGVHFVDIVDAGDPVACAAGKSVVASGGAGALEHFREAVGDGHADTLQAARVFHFGTFTVRQAKACLAEHGIRARV